MIVGRGRKRSGQENSSAPDYPRVVFDLRPGNNLDIVVSWPRDADVEPLAQLLAHLNEGKLAGPISTAIVIHAAMTDQKQKGAQLFAAVQKSVKEQSRGEEDPVVPPTQAGRLNMKVFHS